MSSRKGPAQNFGFSGFHLPPAKPGRRANNAIPPPPSAGVSKQGYSTMNAISQNALAATWGMPRKRAKTEEEYFDEDDDDTPPSLKPSSLAYIPAPGSPSNKATSKPFDDLENEEEVDPLDAFMASIEKQVKTETIKTSQQAIRDDIETEDNEESYYRYMEENPMAGVLEETSDLEIDYDDDGNPIAPVITKKIIDPLPPVDHSLITYEPFERNFYTAHEEIAELTKDKVGELRCTLGLKVTGASPPNPITSFGHLQFDEALLKSIIKSEYIQPTPIQAQAVPAALGGRDIIGIAKTGSGKTAAFIWPLLVHIMDQRELQPGDGPIGLILAPTRELSQQIYNEAKKFGKVYNIQVVCAYGGGSKWEQSKALEAGAEIVVATPGRLIDLVKIKATNLQRVTFLILDEADRMFDMGFEPQVRSICNHVRPDRQTLLFSATFKKKVEKLARDILSDPVRIVQGDVGEANTDVTQIVLMMCNLNDKFNWLTRCLVEFLSAGSVLIFVTKKADAEQVASSLSVKEFQVLLLHGDMDQIERNKVITQFKRNEVSILVATDVAARGLDIPHIRTVINYDIARDIDTHTHRVGRTGRAGEKGTAYTLVTEKDKEFAGHLVRNLEGANQEVPQYLMDLAMQSSWFRKSRFKSGKGKNINVGGCGLGFKERPGRQAALTATSAASASSDLAQNIGSTLARSAAGAKCGPATDRLSAMKAAFKSQYQTQFTASLDDSWQNAQTPHLPPPPPPPPLSSSSSSVPSSVPASSTKRVKKSRWE